MYPSNITVYCTHTLNKYQGPFTLLTVLYRFPLFTHVSTRRISFHWPISTDLAIFRDVGNINTLYLALSKGLDLALVFRPVGNWFWELQLPRRALSLHFNRTSRPSALYRHPWGFGTRFWSLGVRLWHFETQKSLRRRDFRRLLSRPPMYPLCFLGHLSPLGRLFVETYREMGSSGLFPHGSHTRKYGSPNNLWTKLLRLRRPGGWPARLPAELSRCIFLPPYWLGLNGEELGPFLWIQWLRQFVSLWHLPAGAHSSSDLHLPARLDSRVVSWTWL